MPNTYRSPRRLPRPFLQQASDPSVGQRRADEEERNRLSRLGMIAGHRQYQTDQEALHGGGLALEPVGTGPLPLPKYQSPGDVVPGEYTEEKRDWTRFLYDLGLMDARHKLGEEGAEKQTERDIAAAKLQHDYRLALQKGEFGQEKSMQDDRIGAGREEQLLDAEIDQAMAKEDFGREEQRLEGMAKYQEGDEIRQQVQGMVSSLNNPNADSGSKAYAKKRLESLQAIRLSKKHNYHDRTELLRQWMGDTDVGLLSEDAQPNLVELANQNTVLYDPVTRQYSSMEDASKVSANAFPVPLDKDGMLDWRNAMTPSSSSGTGGSEISPAGRTGILMRDGELDVDRILKLKKEAQNRAADKKSAGAAEGEIVGPPSQADEDDAFWQIVRDLESVEKMVRPGMISGKTQGVPKPPGPEGVKPASGQMGEIIPIQDRDPEGGLFPSVEKIAQPLETEKPSLWSRLTDTGFLDRTMGGVSGIPKDTRFEEEAAAEAAAREEALSQFPEEDREEWGTKILDAETPKARFEAERDYFLHKAWVPAGYSTPETDAAFLELLKKNSKFMEDPDVYAAAKEIAERVKGRK